MNLGTRKLLPTALAVLLAASPAFGAAGWWNVAWAHRRAIDVESYQPTKLPGDDVGVVTMPTAGLTRADGADVRVTTSAGKPLPTRVLSTGPGDRAVVAFALEPGTTRYYAYFGCADPPPQAKPLDIRRGVLQQTWANPGGDRPLPVHVLGPSGCSGHPRCPRSGTTAAPRSIASTSIGSASR